MSASEHLGRQFWNHEPYMPTHPGETYTEGSLSPHALRPTHGIEEDHHQERFTDEVEKSGGINRPVEVSYRGRGRYYIENGHHRVAAAQALGHDTVPVRVYHKEGEQPEGLEPRYLQ